MTVLPPPLAASTDPSRTSLLLKNTGSLTVVVIPDAEFSSRLTAAPAANPKDAASRNALIAVNNSSAAELPGIPPYVPKSQLITLPPQWAICALTDNLRETATVRYLQDRALRRAYTKQTVSDAITPEEIKAAYDKMVAAMPNVDEIHARHILVSTEDDAKAIKAQLDGGADFATLAKEKSIEPGAKDSGGDLGYFTQDKMVKPFGDAAFALKVSEISQPVQTQFGWHIIQVLDRRPAAKPTLDAMTQQIGQQLYVQKYRALFDQLRKGATIDIPDAALKAQVESQLGPNQ